jgi:hypothetical protein
MEYCPLARSTSKTIAEVATASTSIYILYLRLHLPGVPEMKFGMSMATGAILSPKSNLPLPLSFAVYI